MDERINAVLVKIRYFMCGGVISYDFVRGTLVINFLHAELTPLERGFYRMQCSRGPSPPVIVKGSCPLSSLKDHTDQGITFLRHHISSILRRVVFYVLMFQKLKCIPSSCHVAI